MYIDFKYGYHIKNIEKKTIVLENKQLATVHKFFKFFTAAICGDFNNPSGNWPTLTVDREGTRLLE